MSNKEGSETVAKCSVKETVYVRVVVFGAGALLQVWRTRRAPLPAPPSTLKKSEWCFSLFRGRCGQAGAPSTSRPVLTKSLSENQNRPCLSFISSAGSNAAHTSAPTVSRHSTETAGRVAIELKESASQARFSQSGPEPASYIGSRGGC